MKTAIRAPFGMVAALLFAVPAYAQDQPSNANQFLMRAIQGDNSEIQLGRLAERNARDPDVRAFGATLVQDHSEARRQAAALAKSMNLRTPAHVTPEARDEYGKLRNLLGRNFDREFVQYMIKDHRKDIREYRDEAQSRRGRISRLAARQLPTLEKHLQMAQNLRRQEGLAFTQGRNANRQDQGRIGR